MATFVDAVTKQIEAQANTYNKEMNRYEKSITMLQSALDMLHPACSEHAECLVEIARCKRLLAVNKKHLRGQWRQDAIEVDEVSMDQSLVGEEGPERKDQLDAKGLEGEIDDNFVDYKEEALKAFVHILESTGEQEAEHPEKEIQQPPVAAGKGAKEAAPEVMDTPPKKTIFSRIASIMGDNRLENMLATFSLEYAESRGNLNKEQAFFYLAQFQYAVSRQALLSTYLKATTEQHPDVQRRRQCASIRRDFSSFSSPFLPRSFREAEESLRQSSKPLQILHQLYSIEEMKEHLPGQTAYLVLQLSDDEQYLYCGFMVISRERKISYHVTKLVLPSQDREMLFKMISTLA